MDAEVDVDAETEVAGAGRAANRVVASRRRSARSGLSTGTLTSDLVPGPVDYATLVSTDGSTTKTPVLIWLHGGGGSHRFLETCRPQLVSCWADRSLPALVVATPSAGWSFYLDRQDGSELWETFLLEEFIPAIRAETGATDGPLLIGGISVGALGALRMAFKHPDRFAAVVAVEPTIEAALTWDRVPSRDRVYMPAGVRRKLFGDPLDHQYWKANHPTSLAVSNSTALAAADLAVYLEAGDDDALHVQYGTELLHRCLFDIGLSHEYRLTKDGNHVGPSVGPRLVEAFRFIGRLLWKSYQEETSVDAVVELEAFADQVRGLELQAGYRSSTTVDGPAGELTVHVQGEGPPVVLLPSLGRGAADFGDLSDRLARAGFQVLRPEPRGWTGSSMALADITLLDLADDIAAVIGELCGGAAAVVGHDFGGQVARTLAAHHPDLVKHMVLLATPGPVPPKPEPATAHRRTFIPELSMEEHLEAVALAFFAPGNDPVVWVDGWRPVLATAQLEAKQRTPTESWSAGGAVDALIVRPADDRIVSAESTRLLANELGGKVSVVEVPGAAHALLPEQPEAVAISVLTWLRRHG
ncbi:MAG: alpha/beta fold hydrolase [Actinomycetota bacterium]